MQIGPAKSVGPIFYVQFERARKKNGLFLPFELKSSELSNDCAELTSGGGRDQRRNDRNHHRSTG